ncbi:MULTISPECIES: LPS export ABC transporter periplasmic protein LptC [unclassified Janthinobacterium]|uniref:LPS export ABC transporter periplasmic protein LptC n=1 Tax=unclassified Janthinobacterium TaxID=2610881 RepID=UPI0003474E8F|nr:MULTISPECIES: LPS export ABC transporter periplasmic protein LptC [unclassified Janthinobacterium]MEC5159148.1 lipopolysaccharide export system protein LptC [Janthinobacterium sp. CG_S6]
MRKRQPHPQRWRTALTLLAGVVFALGSFWLLQVLKQQGQDGVVGQPRNEPDYFVDNFSVVRMGVDGKPAYIVSGVKLTHRPLDDSSDIERPYLRKLSPTTPPMDARALRGRIDQDSSRVQLNGSVVVDRPAGPGAASMNLKTEALTVFPDADRMETDQPVVLLQGASRMSGVGMRANNATGQIEVAQQLRITIPPPPR